MMGCSSSMHSTANSLRADFQTSISDKQKLIIKSTWNTVEENRTKVGKQTFLRVFEVMPELKTKFPGKVDIEQLKSTRTLYGHNKILMKSIENAVTSLDDNESFVTYLVELGRRHQVRPLKAQYLEVIYEALMFSFEDLFQEQWIKETSDAWGALFRFMFEAIKTGLHDT
ncbi:unnamed protein product [Porites lobata]|uniref:Globin domain-containing protein n=1 Tax=Porites lobata TaxID=104759 RepID=A0ABN8NV45_9CNID|nr:unnamed protein product [Porites lobata]